MQVPGEVPEARQIVGRGERVEVRERGGHPAGQRLIVRAPQQRVQPDQPPGATPDLSKLSLQERRLTRVPAIREDQDDGPSIQQARPVLAIESGQALSDLRSPRPVTHRAEIPERPQIRAAPKVGGDVRQTRAEGERLNAAERVLEREEELEEKPAVE